MYSREMFLHALQVETYELQTVHELHASLFATIVAGCFAVLMRAPHSRYHTMLSFDATQEPIVARTLLAFVGSLVAHMLCSVALRCQGVDIWSFVHVVGAAETWPRQVLASVVALGLIVLSEFVPL